MSIVDEYLSARNECKACPKCHSKRLSILKIYQITEEVNLKSGRRLSKKDKNPFLFYHQYKCRKCGWISNIIRDNE